MNEITYIVLDVDGGEMLSRCIESIRKQTRRQERIVIFDNGSDVAAASRAQGDDLIHLRSETNLGFAGGINAAMESVTTPFVAWINNDVVLASEWADRVLSTMSESETIAGAQSIVMRPDRRIDGAGISVDGTIQQIGHGRTIDQPLPDQIWGVSATAALYRVSALRSVAVNDEILRASFFAYYEDVELCARLRAAGFRFALVPEALAIHEGSKSATLLPHRGMDRKLRNRYSVHRLHPEVGRFGALIREDLRRIGALIRHGSFGEAGLLTKFLVLALWRRQ